MPWFPLFSIEIESWRRFPDDRRCQSEQRSRLGKETTRALLVIRRIAWIGGTGHFDRLAPHQKWGAGGTVVRVKPVAAPVRGRWKGERQRRPHSPPSPTSPGQAGSPTTSTPDRGCGPMNTCGALRPRTNSRPTPLGLAPESGGDRNHPVVNCDRPPRPRGEAAQAGPCRGRGGGCPLAFAKTLRIQRADHVDVGRGELGVVVGWAEAVRE